MRASQPRALRQRASRALLRALLWAALLCSAIAAHADDGLQLVLWQEGELQSVQLTPTRPADPVDAAAAPAMRTLDVEEAHALRTPLGSLWKLFVHAWLLDRDQPAPDYVCSSGRGEEVYCCGPGERIDRDQALLKSCGPYFEPARLQIDALAWRSYWSQQQAPAWLLDLGTLQPQTAVRVDELLRLLARLPARAAQQRLLAATVLASPPEVFDALGSQLRVKTWSWHRADQPDARIGGFAGWLADGTPLWAQGQGTSRGVLVRYAAELAPVLAAHALPPAGMTLEPGEDCVQVRMFARYPLRRVRSEGSDAPVAPGALQGRYRLDFDSGSEFAIRSSGELSLTYTDAGPQIQARLRREDYVARVLEREAAAEPLAAARALALVARSYLQQHAERAGDCLLIDDSSARQRVLAQPPGAAARAAAQFSAELVLAGSAVGYHLDTSGPNQLNWRQAQRDAAAGSSVSDLLRSAFPMADLAPWASARAQCERLPEAEAWLRARLPRWRPRLQAEIGYEEVEGFAVCRLLSGRPFVDRVRRRIHVRGLLSQQDRLDLTHEYLHLGFEAHPHGHDENFIEAQTRRLVLE